MGETTNYHFPYPELTPDAANVPSDMHDLAVAIDTRAKLIADSVGDVSDKVSDDVKRGAPPSGYGPATEWFYQDSGDMAAQGLLWNLKYQSDDDRWYPSGGAPIKVLKDDPGNFVASSGWVPIPNITGGPAADPTIEVPWSGLYEVWAQATFQNETATAQWVELGVNRSGGLVPQRPLTRGNTPATAGWFTTISLKDRQHYNAGEDVFMYARCNSNGTLVFAPRYLQLEIFPVYLDG